jgi:hypothetical protein
VSDIIKETITMLRLIRLLFGVGLILFLSGCGDSCESVQDEIQEIGRAIQKNPQTAMERGEELEELKNKLQEMDCLR